MSLIEQTPQKHKEFDPRTQDHGDASHQRGHYAMYKSEDSYDRRGIVDADQRQRKLDLSDIDAYGSMTSAQLEAEANKLLGETPLELPELVYTSENTLAPQIDPSDDEENIDETPFRTEAELGLKSKHEIVRAMARRVTLDVEFEDDDTSDFHVPVRIKNRL